MDNGELSQQYWLDKEIEMWESELRNRREKSKMKSPSALFVERCTIFASHLTSCNHFVDVNKMISILHNNSTPKWNAITKKDPALSQGQKLYSFSGDGRNQRKVTTESSGNF